MQYAHGAARTSRGSKRAAAAATAAESTLTWKSSRAHGWCCAAHVQGAERVRRAAHGSVTALLCWDAAAVAQQQQP